MFKKTSGTQIVRRLLTLAIGVIALQTAPLVMADKYDCPRGWFCAWEHINFEGKMQKTWGFREYVGDSFNDKYSSSWNRTGKTVWLSKHAHCGGNEFHMGPGVEATANFKDFGWNDIVSSVHVGDNFVNHRHC